MSAWVVVPCLLVLRDEFNELSPKRDKGADGTIGDSAHTSSSDHTPDEDSDILRDHDADSKNEVHALDIDSTGPYPRSFDSIVKDIIARERKRWLDLKDICRLEYVIWNRKIYSRIRDFEPIDYSGTDPHTGHAHFSSRYLTTSENDIRPWGVSEGEAMAFINNQTEFEAALTKWADSKAGSAAICDAAWNTDDVIPAPGNPTSGNMYIKGVSYLQGILNAVVTVRGQGIEDAARDAALAVQVAGLDAGASSEEVAAKLFEKLAPMLSDFDRDELYGALKRLAGDAAK